jgi:DNA-binding transcriptional LysR family regulator
MQLSRVDLNLFVVFDAIYTEGSISRAAELLHLTQPAVSHALGRLRGTLGDELFVRTSRGVNPTPMARNMIKAVRQSLQVLQSVVQEGHRFEPATAERTFRLSLRDIFEVMLLPGLSAVLNRVAPGIVVECQNVPRQEMVNELATGRLDLAAEVLVNVQSDVCYQKVSLNTPLVCVMRVDNPAAQDRLTFERYLELKHVLVSSRFKGPGYEDMKLARRGHRRRIGFRTQHYYSAALVVSQTDMALTVPRSFAETLQQNIPLRVVELPFAVQAPELFLYWHRSVDRDPANQWLRRQIFKLVGIEESFSEHPAKAD